MALDFYPVIMRAVGALDPNTQAARRAIYDRARKALVAGLQPFPPQTRKEERAALEAAISRIEREFEQLLSSAEFNKDHPDDRDELGRSYSKWRRRLELLFLTIAVGIVGGAAALGGVEISSPPPPVTIVQAPTKVQRDWEALFQVNHQYETGRSTAPPKVPPSSYITDPAILNERREESGEQAQTELRDAINTLRRLRVKLLASSELLDRLDRVISFISEHADEVKEAAEVVDLIHTTYELAKELKESKERKEREEDRRKREENIRRRLAELESEALRIFHAAGIS